MEIHLSISCTHRIGVVCLPTLTVESFLLGDCPCIHRSQYKDTSASRIHGLLELEVTSFRGVWCADLGLSRSAKRVCADLTTLMSKEDGCVDLQCGP